MVILKPIESLKYLMATKDTKSFLVFDVLHALCQKCYINQMSGENVLEPSIPSLQMHHALPLSFKLKIAMEVIRNVALMELSNMGLIGSTNQLINLTQFKNIQSF